MIYYIFYVFLHTPCTLPIMHLWIFQKSINIRINNAVQIFCKSRTIRAARESRISLENNNNCPNRVINHAILNDSYLGTCVWMISSFVKVIVHLVEDFAVAKSLASCVSRYNRALCCESRHWRKKTGFPRRRWVSQATKPRTRASRNCSGESVASLVRAWFIWLPRSNGSARSEHKALPDELELLSFQSTASLICDRELQRSAIDIKALLQTTTKVVTYERHATNRRLY